MNNMGPLWLLALSSALLQAGSYVSCAQTKQSSTKQSSTKQSSTKLSSQVDGKLVMQRTVSVTPTTKVEYGNSASIKCTLHVASKVSEAVYHLWVYREGLPYRIAAFHPPSTKNEYPRELVAHPECYTNHSSQACAGRKITAKGGKVVNVGNDTVTFTLELKFQEVICCDNDEYYCWFFIYSYDLPSEGFNSTHSARLSVNCNPKVLAQPCYEKNPKSG